MTTKPATAAGYDPETTRIVRDTAFYVATKLNDLMDDIVIVGGLVPLLLIDSDKLPEDTDPHPGTRDVDLGFSLTLLNDELYQTLEERLRSAGFEPDENDEGKKQSQCWRHGERDVTIDFLIPPTSPKDKPGRLKNLAANFAAIIAPGLRR